MQRFRSTWLALIGGALLITLSVSAAFGAAPSGTRDATRGQSIAAAVHALIFGADEEVTDDPLVEEDDETSEESEELDESEDLDDTDDVDDTDETDEESDETANAHGECV